MVFLALLRGPVQAVLDKVLNRISPGPTVQIEPPSSPAPAGPVSPADNAGPSPTEEHPDPAPWRLSDAYSQAIRDDVEAAKWFVGPQDARKEGALLKAAVEHPFVVRVDRRRHPGPIDDAGPTDGIDLTLVRARGTDWTPDRLLDSVPGIAEIYAQCDMVFHAVDYVAVTPKDGDSFIKHVYDGDRLRALSGPMTAIAHTVTQLSRPELFFIGDWDHDSQTTLAFAFYNPVNDRISSGLTSTGWMHPKILRRRGDAKSVTAQVAAHELGHILLRSGHVREPDNLMYPTYPSGTRLTAKQCVQIRRSRLVRQVDYR